MCVYIRTRCCAHMKVNSQPPSPLPPEVFSTSYPHFAPFSISPPNPLFSLLSVSLFLYFYLLIHSSLSLHLAEYLHLSDLISFIFFPTHIYISPRVLLLSPLSIHGIFFSYSTSPFTASSSSGGVFCSHWRCWGGNVLAHSSSTSVRSIPQGRKSEKYLVSVHV